MMFVKKRGAAALFFQRARDPIFFFRWSCWDFMGWITRWVILAEVFWYMGDLKAITRPALEILKLFTRAEHHFAPNEGRVVADGAANAAGKLKSSHILGSRPNGCVFCYFRIAYRPMRIYREKSLAHSNR